MVIWQSFKFQKSKIKKKGMSSQILEPAVAHFIKKTYQILRNKDYEQVIHWLPSGREFAIRDISTFEQQILPVYFRHRNVHSFVRQLNMYGFHKSRKDPNKNIFSNEFFRRGREDLLPEVRRKCKIEEKNTENILPMEPAPEARTSPQTQEIPLEKDKASHEMEFLRREGEDKSMILPYQPYKRCSLNLLICASEVMSENPDVYSNLRVQGQAFDSSDSENLSIEDEIEKERKMGQTLRSGVSLVQTHNLLKTHNHIQN